MLRRLTVSLIVLATVPTFQASASASTSNRADVMRLVTTAARHIDSMWRRAGAGYLSPRNVIGYSGGGHSACGPLTPGNAFYCPRDRSIYYDVDFLGEMLAIQGDFAVVTVLAHEWGHHMQTLLRQHGGPAIRRELQADCLAGGYAQFAGYSGVLDAGDLQEGSRSLFRAGDRMDVPWFHPSAHGSARQRARAFQHGLAGGTWAC